SANLAVSFRVCGALRVVSLGPEAVPCPVEAELPRSVPVDEDPTVQHERPLRRVGEEVEAAVRPGLAQGADLYQVAVLVGDPEEVRRVLDDRGAVLLALTARALAMPGLRSAVALRHAAQVAAPVEPPVVVRGVLARERSDPHVPLVAGRKRA